MVYSIIIKGKEAERPRVKDMSYKLFIRKNNLEDTMKNYESYLEKNDSMYKMMNDGMKKQYAEFNFGTRFCK